MTAPAPNSTRSTTLGRLAALDPVWRLRGAAETLVTGVAYNSRRVIPGDLFVALPGGYFDGHNFAAEAVARGAAGLVVERPLGLGVPELNVDDARAALAPIAAEFYGHPSKRLRVVGITGTDGKTTTSYLLDAILRDAGVRTGLIGTIAVKIDGEVVEAETRQTTPESLDVQRHLAEMLDRGVDTPIIEATSHGLDLHRLDCVRFIAGGVTNITHEHLEHHKTIAAYRRAKAKLFERVSESRGDAVINLDDEGAREMVAWSNGARLTTYSLESDADLHAEAFQLTVTGSRFDLIYRGERRPVALPMLGGYNVANALCATGLALAIGVDLHSIVASLSRAPDVPGRMERIDCGQPFAVIVDYAHTPESLTKVLTLLRHLNPDGRVIVACGSAGERDVTKRPMQGAVCAELADYSIFTTEDPRMDDPDQIIAEIAEGAKQRGAREGVEFARITDRMDAVRAAVGRAQPGDVVLLAGKGHERSIIWGREKRPWDEPAAARQALAELGYEAPA
jgi:UDP-N-acetylmuramoyl-L-alanyl-D-glutamate--2,6-diaminopimelate ligase